MNGLKKYIIISGICVFLLLFFTLALILYDKGVYDISFIKRDETEAVTELTEPDTETEPETVVETETDAPETDPYDYGVLPDGVEPTEDVYSDKTALYKLQISLPKTEYSGSMTRVRYETTYKKLLRIITAYNTEEIRYSVDVYMGMLVVADENKLSFYNGKGELLYTYEGGEELVFAYERDEEGRALFIKNGVYYFIENNTLKKSDFDKRLSRGVNFNYTSDYGKNAQQNTAFYNGNKYGIKDYNGNTVKNAVYTRAYDYSENKGLVSNDGAISYLDNDGTTVFGGYYEVELKDEGGIGSIYFDGGYVTVRKITRDVRKNVVEDDEVLVDKYGNEFVLPVGFKLIAYSNQQILVKKNNKYGFFAVKGAWTADPDYTYATPYYEGLAVVGNENGCGVIDLNGNFVIPLSYKHISVCSGGIIVCYSDSGYEVFVKANK